MTRVNMPVNPALSFLKITGMLTMSRTPFLTSQFELPMKQRKTGQFVLERKGDTLLSVTSHGCWLTSSRRQAP